MPDGLRTSSGELGEETRAARERAYLAARRIKLSFVSQRDRVGSQLGAGTGASTEYLDHRPFAPGDDPRYLDWRAFARSGQLMMRVFRAEVTLSLDVILDVSRSMFFEPAKRRRTLELFFFAVQSGLGASASVLTYQADGERVSPLEAGLVDRSVSQALEARSRTASTPAPALSRLPLRARALRVLISDLLFQGDFDGLLRDLTAGDGPARVLVPYSPAESNPTWVGDCQLADAETTLARSFHFDRSALARYRRSYSSHFEHVAERARRRGALMARVTSEGGLVDALAQDGARQRIVVPC